MNNQALILILLVVTLLMVSFNFASFVIKWVRGFKRHKKEQALKFNKKFQDLNNELQQLEEQRDELLYVNNRTLEQTNELKSISSRIKNIRAQLNEFDASRFQK